MKNRSEEKRKISSRYSLDKQLDNEDDRREEKLRRIIDPIVVLSAR